MQIYKSTHIIPGHNYRENSPFFQLHSTTFQSRPLNTPSYFPENVRLEIEGLLQGFACLCLRFDD